MAWGFKVLLIGILALGVYGGTYGMNNYLGVEVNSDGFVLEILQYILVIGIILTIIGGALIIIQRRSSR